MAEDKKIVDWVVVEADYRAGTKPLRQIAEENGISHVAIGKRAKRLEWTRNLAAKIQAQADAKVTKAAVTAEVTKERRLVTEQTVVEANAELQFQIRMAHRKDIARARALFGNLASEVEVQTDNLADFQKLGELLDETGPDENGKWKIDKRNQIYQKVIDTLGRVDSAKKLTEILEKVVRLEREAFGIDKGDGEASNPVDDLLKKIHGERAGA